MTEPWDPEQLGPASQNIITALLIELQPATDPGTWLSGKDSLKAALPWAHPGTVDCRLRDLRRLGIVNWTKERRRSTSGSGRQVRVALTADGRAWAEAWLRGHPMGGVDDRVMP